MLILLIGIFSLTMSQEATVSPNLNDSLSNYNTKPSTNILKTTSLSDTLSSSHSDSLSLRDTLATKDSVKVNQRAIDHPIIKHEFNHREQIITGSVIMACLILMMAAMNNYNPR